MNPGLRKECSHREEQTLRETAQSECPAFIYHGSVTPVTMGHGEQLLPSHTHSSCYTAGKCQPSLGHLTLEANMPYKQQPCSWWQKSVQGTSAAWLYYGVSGRGGQLAAGISGTATPHRLDTDNAAFPHQGTESLGLTQGT